MTPVQIANTFLTVAAANPGVIPPNAMLALGLAQGALALIDAAQSTGVDVTDADLADLRIADDAAKAADAAAQAK